MLVAQKNSFVQVVVVAVVVVMVKNCHCCCVDVIVKISKLVKMCT